jgi:hypothetical protein
VDRFGDSEKEDDDAIAGTVQRSLDLCTLLGSTPSSLAGCTKHKLPQANVGHNDRQKAGNLCALRNKTFNLAK